MGRKCENGEKNQDPRTLDDIGRLMSVTTLWVNLHKPPWFCMKLKTLLTSGPTWSQGHYSPMGDVAHGIICIYIYTRHTEILSWEAPQILWGLSLGVHMDPPMINLPPSDSLSSHEVAFTSIWPSPMTQVQLLLTAGLGCPFSEKMFSPFICKASDSVSSKIRKCWFWGFHILHRLSHPSYSPWLTCIIASRWAP